MESSIYAAFWGFVIGDSMGVPVKYSRREKLFLHPVTRLLEGGTFKMPKGSWSYSTSLTLCMMDSICKQKKLDYLDMEKHLVRWQEENKYTSNQVVFDNDLTTKRAIYEFLHSNKEVTLCGKDGCSDDTNGSLLRMFPIAVYLYREKARDYDIYFSVKNASSITHRNEICIMACYIWVKFLIFLMEKKSIKESFYCLRQLDYTMYFKKEIIVEFYPLLKVNLLSKSIWEIQSNNTVLDTLMACFWILLHCESFTSSLIGAVNLGGESDTIASLVGCAAGLFYGKESIPEIWKQEIKRNVYLEEKINEFITDIVL